MCGIFGALGQDCVQKTVEALHFLEYRGYDSAGIAYLGKDITVTKTVGRVSALEAKLPQNIVANSAIGHTRWATHGGVSENNAHPFLSNDGTFAICHNGIIENYKALKEQLAFSGVKFSSQTDSETVAHLLQQSYRNDVLAALLKTANKLEGAFAVLCQTTHDGRLFAIKNKSPLVVGVGEQGVCLCSDIRCVARWAQKVAVVPDGTVVVAGDDVRFFDFDGKPKQVEMQPAMKAEMQSTVSGDIMLSEIYEIPSRVRDAIAGYFKSGGLQLSKRQAKSISRIYFLGCGTAYNSGLEVATVARSFLHLDLFPVIASEFVYDSYPVCEGTLAFCISQSGETADTVRAAERVVEMGGTAYAVTNTLSSSLCRVCKKVANVFAGGEFAVASTKAYNCQLVTMLLLMLDIAFLRGEISRQDRQSVWDGMDSLPYALERTLATEEKIKALCQQVKQSSAVFFVGRIADFPTATEGSLKLKEISYIHSEAYPSGELKHGTLALMERGVTVVVLSTDCNLVEKNNSTANEISSREATVVTISPYKGQGVITIPTVHRYLYGVVAVVPLQLLAYHTAKALGRDVDKPRNLAKSVTVE